MTDIGFIVKTAKGTVVVKNPVVLDVEKFRIAQEFIKRKLSKEDYAVLRDEMPIDMYSIVRNL